MGQLSVPECIACQPAAMAQFLSQAQSCYNFNPRTVMSLQKVFQARKYVITLSNLFCFFLEMWGPTCQLRPVVISAAHSQSPAMTGWPMCTLVPGEQSYLGKPFDNLPVALLSVSFWYIIHFWRFNLVSEFKYSIC